MTNLAEWLEWLDRQPRTRMVCRNTMWSQYDPGRDARRLRHQRRIWVLNLASL